MKLHLLVLFVLLSTAMLVGQTFRGTVLGSVTVAPATNAPEASVTEPRTVPRKVWPTSMAVESRTNTTNKCSFIPGPP